jgi:hypothetical protein
VSHDRADRMYLEAQRRGEAAYRILQEASPELAEAFRQRLHLTVARFGGRPKTDEEARWMLNGLWDLIDNFFRGLPLTRTDVERVAGGLRAEHWRPPQHWPLEQGGPSMGADQRPEATVDGLLRSLSMIAERYLRRLAEMIEARDMIGLRSAVETAYHYISVLRGYQRDFELPEEWPARIDSFFNEFEYLRALALELMRRAPR